MRRKEKTTKEGRDSGKIRNKEIKEQGDEKRTKEPTKEGRENGKEGRKGK